MIESEAARAKVERYAVRGPEAIIMQAFLYRNGYEARLRLPAIEKGSDLGRAGVFKLFVLFDIEKLAV
jgi:hypothetical protein